METDKTITAPELLAPAGNLEKLKIAFEYGADAVYIGGEEFSLRVAADNFTNDEIKQGIDFAKKLNKKVYLTANVIPHNNDIDEYAKFLTEVRDIGLDAVILSDLGMFGVTKEIAPELDIHISTQANNVNYKSADMWYNMGAKRVILAREMSLAEISQIRERTNPELELEAFVHGAMCISYSGRCLLSNYMAGRDGNGGACAHPCRWKYYLMEEKRPGEYMPVFENERGTFIYNSKDLCMIEHIDKLIQSGLTSFKIEGRVKSEFYVATTGFYFNKPGGTEQRYGGSSYIREYDMVGVVEDYDSNTGIAKLIQKNRFFKGDEVEFLCTDGTFFTQEIEYLTDENGEPTDVANHPQSVVYVKTSNPVTKDSFMRKKRSE